MFEEGIHAEASGRVRVERGPVSMVVSAWADGESRPDACLKAASCVDALLAELASAMPLLVRAWPLTSAEDFGMAAALVPSDKSPLGYRMWRAAQATGHPEMTPLCAVAGAISDAVVEAVLAELACTGLSEGPAVKVIVNNGGDISLFLSPGQSVTVGLVPSLQAEGADQRLHLDACSPVRGIATSGFGGRGLTQGVADSVTVFAASGVVADALATRLANASRIDSPRVRQMAAGQLRPGCDIAKLPVTVDIGPLTDAEKALALDGIRKAAQPLMDSGIVCALRASVQGKVLWISDPSPMISLRGGFLHGS